jgi:hypothetical protein
MASTNKPKPRQWTKYTPEIGVRICERIATEAISLKAICKADDMPGMTTVFKWLGENEDFAKLYAHAREAQADLLFDETLEIADDSANDWEERKHFAGDDESPQVNGEAIARAKLRIDTRKWMAAHLRPKKYGEKLDLNQTVAVAPDLASLLERVATGGKRLAHDEE